MQCSHRCPTTSITVTHSACHTKAPGWVLGPRQLRLHCRGHQASLAACPERALARQVPWGGPLGCTVVTSPHWTDETRLLLAHRSPGDWGGARRGPEGPAVFRRGRGRKCGSHYICILGAHTHSPMSQLGSRLPLSSVSAMLCGGTERGVQNWHLARVAASLTGRWGGLLGGGSQEWGTHHGKGAGPPHTHRKLLL